MDLNLEVGMDDLQEVGMDDLQEVDDAGIHRNYYTGMTMENHSFPLINTTKDLYHFTPPSNKKLFIKSTPSTEKTKGFDPNMDSILKRSTSHQQMHQKMVNRSKGFDYQFEKRLLN